MASCVVYHLPILSGALTGLHSERIRGMFLPSFRRLWLNSFIINLHFVLELIYMRIKQCSIFDKINTRKDFFNLLKLMSEDKVVINLLFINILLFNISQYSFSSLLTDELLQTTESEFGFFSWGASATWSVEFRSEDFGCGFIVSLNTQQGIWFVLYPYFLAMTC